MTVPVPVPARATLRRTGGLWIMLNVAVTVWFALSGTTQVGLLLQLPPFHPPKVEFAPAVAVRVT